VVRQLGTRVDPATARIAVDGEPIRREAMVYFAVNKPKGYVSTNLDPAGRPRVVDLLPEIPERVYTVGRLDEDSTGLMILTNDGALANGLAHPRYGVEKMYRALVAGLPAPETIAKLTEGVWLSDGKVRAKRARIAGRQGQATMLELVLAEGKKREIRRMLSKLGHKVMSLNRVAVGPVTLKGLPVGECRPLTRHEVELLRKVASGIAVSVPHFAESEPSSRPRRDRGRQDRPHRRSEHARGSRPHPREADRPGPIEEGGGPRPPRRPAGGPGRASSRGGSRPATPQDRRPAATGTRGGPPPRRPRGHAVDGGTPHETAAASKRPDRRANQALDQPRTPSGKPQPKGARPVSAPAEETTPRRRIIGMGMPEPAASPRPTISGRPGRKRPVPRKARPPRSILGRRPGRSAPEPGPDDEES
jgi:23S rRNA pseudouridine2605 synthase